MAKSADAHGLGPCGRKAVGVQVPLLAPISRLTTKAKAILAFAYSKGFLSSGNGAP